MKLKRIENRNLLNEYIKMSCLVCESNRNVAGHHIKHKGSGGHDVEWNLMPLCFNCHVKLHAGPFTDFVNKYDVVLQFLISNDWELVGEKWWHDDIH